MEILIGNVFNKPLKVKVQKRKSIHSAVKPDIVIWGKESIVLGTNLNLRKLRALPNRYRQAKPEAWEEFVKESFSAVFY